MAGDLDRRPRLGALQDTARQLAGSPLPTATTNTRGWWHSRTPTIHPLNQYIRPSGAATGPVLA